MGLKKYEIITVGSDKRVRALRSWQVGDRYVNIGDVGGIVYDEKTLSQDGACWLFRGNFGFPGARIGGDSIVDVGETTLSAEGSPLVDILGSSVVVGSKLQFASRQTEADAVVLTADDFEQGSFSALISGAPLTPVNSANYIRLKKPVFSGGKPVTLKCGVPGYTITAVALDRDNTIITNAPTTQSGTGVVITVPAGQYFSMFMSKNPISATVPADATAAQITFTGTYDTKLSIIDSRLEINPVTSAGTTTIRPGGTYTITPGAKYPDSVIQNSKVSILTHATAARTVTLMAEFIDTSAVIDASVELAPAPIGIYKNVKNLAFSGSVTGDTGVGSRGVIQATDCDNFAVSSTIFPGLAAAKTANMPFIFQGCNVPNGRFYHHVQIANTYKNIDFAKASADLGKAMDSDGVILVSSEVEGMYRAAHRDTGHFGALVESWESVKSLRVLNNNPSSSYGTTIYKDAYFKGLFDFEGTNVFGNKVRSHPLAQVLNVQPRVVQGNLTLTVGQRPTLVPSSLARVVIDRPIRINTAKGITVSNIPTGIQATFACVDGQGKYVVNSTWKEGTATVTNLAQLDLPAAYLMFKKANDSPITTEELAGVTVTVYNGCKIVNTGETAGTMKGNIRVEDNATLVNASIVGSGYFGGNSIAQGLAAEGLVYMKDNAVFAPTIIGTPKANILRMTDNASFTGALAGAWTRLVMSDNTRFDSATKHNTSGIVEMRDNASVSGSGSVSVSGVLVLEDDASIAGGVASISGDITLCGSYNQTVNKMWTGKRVIDSQNAPTYDDNVKTKYDF